MWINKLEIARFRNIENCSLKLNTHLNIFYGSNGSGKSSLLEALYCLSTGHTFRTNKTSPIVKSGSIDTTIFGEISNNGVLHRLGIRRSIKDQTVIRVDGRNADTQSDIALLLPVVGVSPESEDLLEGGNKGRLNYLDWILFHVEQGFRDNWRLYRRSLKQRNSALKDHKHISNAFVWNGSLTETGEFLNMKRKQLVAELIPILDQILSQLIQIEGFAVTYKQGWPKDLTLLEALHASAETDSKMGFTHYGPHRGDLLLRMEGKGISEHLSRGQRKMINIALRLAQAKYYAKIIGNPPILFIDDLSAELDRQRRKLVIETIINSQIQTFLTTTSYVELGDYLTSEHSLFHVEQGEVTNVV